MFFYIFRREILAKLLYLVLGHHFCAAFQREARGLKKAPKVRLT